MKKTLSLLAVAGAAALSGSAAPAEIVCEGAYGGHLQGVCTDGTSIWWSFTKQIVRTDLNGRALVVRDAPSHQGDLCVKDGTVYVAVNRGKFNQERGGDSQVTAYDAATLEPKQTWKLPDMPHGAGGMTWKGDRFYVIGGLPATHEKNYVYEYTPEFKLVKRHELDTGYTLLGIQTAAYEGGRFLFGIYGGAGNPSGVLECPDDLGSFRRCTGRGNTGMATIDGVFYTAAIFEDKAARRARKPSCRGRLVADRDALSEKTLYVPKGGRGVVRIFFEGRDKEGWEDAGYRLTTNGYRPLTSCSDAFTAPNKAHGPVVKAVGVGEKYNSSVPDVVRGVRRAAEKGETFALHFEGTPENVGGGAIGAAVFRAVLDEAKKLDVRVIGGGDDPQIGFITIDPGHFHAALVQNRPYDGVKKDVLVFAPQGDDLQSHLNLIKAFNGRAENPTDWNEVVHAGPDFLKDFLKTAKGMGAAERRSSVVILAGRNNVKPDYYLAAVKAGVNVLSDKPMAVNEAAFLKFAQAAAIARKNGIVFDDIMTERNEITTILQRALTSCKALYGEQEKGTPDDPAVTKESVHHFCKLVNGKPLRRPGWYYDTEQQGEAIVDVTTHLVDLVQWECFPDVTLKTSDVKMLKARTWATPISAENYRTSTGLETWPDYLKPSVDAQNVLQCKANGEFTYALRGVHAKVSVIWNFMAPKGTGDTHYSLMRGTKAEVVIRQGPAEGYRPRVYVKPRPHSDRAALEKALAEAVADFGRAFPGVTYSACEDGWVMNVPQKYEIGHEAHFSQVMRAYLDFVRTGREPEDRIPNLLVKYHTLVEAWKASR